MPDVTRTEMVIPDFYQGWMNDIWDTAGTVASRPYVPYNGPRIADWTGDQQNAFDMVRDGIGRGQQGYADAMDFVRESAGGVDPASYAAAMSGGTDLGPAQTYSAPTLGPAQTYDAAQGVATTADATRGVEYLDDYMNPFMDEVVDRSMGDLDRAEQIRASEARRRAAGNSAFGGSRTAVLEGLINEDFNDQRGDTSARLRMDGWNTALGAGMADANRITSNNQFNAGQQNAMAEANAARADAAARYAADMGNQFGLTQFGADTDAARYAADAGNNFALTQGQMDQQTALANQGATNDAARFNATADQQAQEFARQMAAQAGLDMAQLQSMSDSAYERDADRLFEIGEMERGLQQSGLDMAYDDFLNQQGHDRANLDMLLQTISAMPNPMGQQTTAPSPDNTGNNISAVGSLLGGLGSLGGLGGLGKIVGGLFGFSDRRLKQNIQALGGGLYEWEYTFQPGVKHVGVMADEVPARYRLRGVSGFDMVDYGLMAMEAA